jgi:hypothetical protein
VADSLIAATREEMRRADGIAGVGGVDGNGGVDGVGGNGGNELAPCLGPPR